MNFRGCSLKAIPCLCADIESRNEDASDWVEGIVEKLRDISDKVQDSSEELIDVPGKMEVALEGMHMLQHGPEEALRELLDIFDTVEAFIGKREIFSGEVTDLFDEDEAASGESSALQEVEGWPLP